MHKMPHESSALCQFRDYVDHLTGLYFADANLKSFERKIQMLAKKLKFDDLYQCLAWFKLCLPLERQVELIAEYFTIGETYFFRDLSNFQTLEEKALPERLQSCRASHQLSIWSAACSTGEELYSIAMILEHILGFPKDWQITLLGTDLNQSFVEKAALGIYREWSFRSTKQIKKYFKKDSLGQYHISPTLQKAVLFKQFNLINNSASAEYRKESWDIIFCCNVLIYFSSQQISKVIDQLANSLKNGGWLFVSAVEVPFIKHPLLSAVETKSTTAFRKESSCFKKKWSKHVNLPAPKVDLKVLRKEGLAYQTSEKNTQIDLKNNETKHLKKTIEEKPVWLDEYERGNYKKVIDLLKKRLDPLENNLPLLSTTFEEVILLIRAYANQKLLKEAIHWCEIAFQVDRLSSELYYLHSSIYQEMGDTELAITSLKKALFLDSEFVMAHFLLGNLLLAQKKSHEANRAFQNAVKLLSKLPQETILPHSDGIKAGSLVEIIMSLLYRK